MKPPTLHFYHPESQKWEPISLARQVCTIGRTEENDVRLDDATVSRRHAQLLVDQRGVWIMDMNTTNGVMVNQARIPAGKWTHLENGAYIEIGKNQFRLELSPAQPPIYQAPPAQPPPAVRPQPSPNKQRSKLPVLAAAGVLVVCACLTLAGALAAWRFYPQIAQLIPINPGATQAEGAHDAQPQAPTATPTPVPVEPPTVVEDLPATPGGMVKDSHGAALEIPAASVPDAQPASLQSASLSPGMQAALAPAYQVESLAYSVVASDQDGNGAAVLRLPAPSPDSRLMVLVDNRFLGLLDVAPQDGELQVKPFLGAPGSANSYPTAAESSTPNRYFVITPKPGTSRGPAASRQWASYLNQAGDPDGQSCITEFWVANSCWRNPESSVYVFWTASTVPAELKDTEFLRIIDMIKSVSEIMRAYNQDYKFTNAAISKSNPVYVIIDPNEAEPTYSQKTGNVYMNWKAVGTITGKENHCALAHELMHFTEDTAYNMSAAAVSNPKAWWQEMAAENGAFLIDPACIDRNLATYGHAVTKASLLPLQSESLQWDRNEGARYIQALQMYISMCEAGPNCALSQTKYVNAINSGSYPFEDAAVLSAFQRSAKDMGLFLLGKPPAEARADAHIPAALKTGGGFAEYIRKKAVPDFKLEISNNGGQIQSANAHEAAVKATIAQGGEYPLWVSNGKGIPDNPREGYTSLPGLLHIDAGTKLWYSLDAGDPIFSDGSKELTLGPLSDKLGAGLVRLVAIAPDAAATFSAQLQPADLSGDWLAQLSNPKVQLVNCPNTSSDNNKNGFSTDDIAKLDMVGILSSYGTYIQDAADPAHYSWEGSLPEGVTGEAEINVKADAIEVKYRIDVPKPTTSGWLPFAPGVGLGGPARLSAAPVSNSQPSGWFILASLAVFLAAGMAVLLKRGLPAASAAARFNFRRLATTACLAVVLFVGAFWLSGCFGLNIWGTFEGTYTFKKLEFIDPNAPAEASSTATNPLTGLKWKLHDGVLNNTTDLFVEVTTTDADGKETSEVQECKYTVTSGAEGFIGPQDMVPQPEK